MATKCIFFLLFVLFEVQCLYASDTPTASAWPPQFHSLIFLNSSKGILADVQYFYDWTNGRSSHIMHYQQRNVIHNIEWNNGTTFYYDLDSQSCYVTQDDAGILLLDWLDNATYLGQEQLNGLTCNVWSKGDIVEYWEDVETNRPVHWKFFGGSSADFMTFDVGAVVEHSQIQAPAVCFSGEDDEPADISLLKDLSKDPLRKWWQVLENSVGMISSHSL